MSISSAVGFAMAFLMLPFFIVYLLRGIRQRSIERDEKQFLEWFLENNLEAFRTRHPDAIQSGRFTCPDCEGRKIIVRGSDRSADLREHVCHMCGKSLYVSRVTN